MPMTNLKQEAHRLIEQLPEDATWDDLMYQLYVRQAIEAFLPIATPGVRSMCKRYVQSLDFQSESTLDPHGPYAPPHGANGSQQESSKRASARLRTLARHKVG